jgi:hypothetical protein
MTPWSVGCMRGITFGGRYRTEIFPNHSLNLWQCVLQLSSNSMHLLSSGMPVLWKCSFTEWTRAWKNQCLKIFLSIQEYDCHVDSTGECIESQSVRRRWYFPTLSHKEGVALTTHPCLVPRLRKNRTIHLLPFCAFMACSRVSYTPVNLPVNKDF